MFLFVISLSLNGIETSAGSNSLCARHYTTTQTLISDLRSEPNIREFQTDRNIIVFYDNANLTLWWVGLKEGAQPIVTCKKKIQARNLRADAVIEADCGNRNPEDCVAQVKMMNAAKF